MGINSTCCLLNWKLIGSGIFGPGSEDIVQVGPTWQAGLAGVEQVHQSHLLQLLFQSEVVLHPEARDGDRDSGFLHLAQPAIQFLQVQIFLNLKPGAEMNKDKGTRAGLLHCSVRLNGGSNVKVS